MPDPESGGAAPGAVGRGSVAETGDGAAATRTGDATQILERLADGDAGAADDLLPVVYDELRRIAAAAMRRERSDHTLQPTAIVHEAYMRLVGGQPVRWQGRAHFMSVAAGAIRRVLIDHARRTQRTKRGGGRQRVPLEDHVVGGTAPAVDLIDLHEALERLEAMNPRQSRVVELRFFGGLTNDDVAEVMGLARSTVSDEIAFARAWLARELSAK